MHLEMKPLRTSEPQSTELQRHRGQVMPTPYTKLQQSFATAYDAIE
jgi:hypothetical protein